MGKEKLDWLSYRKTPRVSADFLIEREMIIGVEPSLTTLLRLYYPTREQRAKFLTNTALDLDGQTPLSVWKQGGRQRVKQLLVQRYTNQQCCHET